MVYRSELSTVAKATVTLTSPCTFPLQQADNGPLGRSVAVALATRGHSIDMPRRGCFTVDRASVSAIQNLPMLPYCVVLVRIRVLDTMESQKTRPPGPPGKTVPRKVVRQREVVSLKLLKERATRLHAVRIAGWRATTLRRTLARVLVPSVRTRCGCVTSAHRCTLRIAASRAIVGSGRASAICASARVHGENCRGHTIAIHVMRSVVRRMRRALMVGAPSANAVMWAMQHVFVSTVARTARGA